MGFVRLFINNYLKYAPRFIFYRNRERRRVNNVVLYYRISDHGYKKEKPSYITKEKCLKNALEKFPLEKVKWNILADNVSEDTYQMICRYVPSKQVKRVCVGNGAGTFRIVYQDAIQNNLDDLVYFLEDDYLHLEGSLETLVNAAEINYTDYFTLYDHPDKYGNNSPNPFVHGGENTKIYWCKNHHWKETNSTTMTFAAFVNVLIEDKKIFWRWTETGHPFDFQIFINLKLYSHRKLSCPIPSMSTHGETKYLSNGIEWNKVK